MSSLGEYCAFARFQFHCISCLCVLEKGGKKSARAHAIHPLLWLRDFLSAVAPMSVTIKAVYSSSSKRIYEQGNKHRQAICLLVPTVITLVVRTAVATMSVTLTPR